MNAVAIIQARMSSTRLPGKVLMPLAGKPILWHIIHRLRRCEELDHIVVATSQLEADDPLARFAEEQGVIVVRGSESNVLRRFGQAARATRAGVILRVTGDVPLIDSASVDRWLRALKASGSDLVRTRNQVPQIHEGLCVFSRRALDFLLRTVPGDPVAREHVSSWFRQHPGSATITLVDADPRLVFQGARLSVDTPADLDFLERVHEELKAAPGELDMADLVRLLRERPELLEINSHVHQKGADEPTQRVLVRARDIDLTRALALGRELRDHFGLGVRLAIEPAALHSSDRFPTEVLTQHDDEESWLEHLLDRLQPDTVVLLEEGRPIRAAFDARSALALCGFAGSSAHREWIELGDDPAAAAASLLSALRPETRAA